MVSTETLVREHVSEESRNAPEFRIEIRAFCERVEETTLNLKVREAITFKKQGHFSKAMLNMAEANRDQVIAIRKIQSLLGQIRNKPYPEVVFERFRQFEPFEIGIADADEVLSILAGLEDEKNPDLKKHKLELHDHERRKKDEEDYLSFLERRFGEGSESENVGEIKLNIGSITRNIGDLRNWILEQIFVVTNEALKELRPGMNRDQKFLELSHNIFLVVTSPILTKRAEHVATETS